MNPCLGKATHAVIKIESSGGSKVAKLNKVRQNIKIKAKRKAQKTSTTKNIPNDEEEKIPPQERVRLMVKEKNIAQIRKRIQENISNKPKSLIEQLKEFFNGGTRRYLPNSNLFKDGIPSPFERLSTNFDERSSTRLSVTKLLWFSHCELERIYLLYLSDNFSEFVEGIEHGVILHKSLEKEVHPTRRICISVNGRKIYVETDKHHYYGNFHSGNENSTESNDLLKSEITETGSSRIGPRSYPTVVSSKNPKNSQAYLLLETLGRLIVLLRHGSCREIYIHGYFTNNSNNFTIDGDGEGIPINGMIDELTLVSDDHEVLTSLIKHINGPKVTTDSYDDFIREFNRYMEINKPQIYLNVKEYKSRKSGFKPNRSFVRTNLLQASIYYKLFKLGASDANAYYRSWIHESIGRGLHVFEPLDNETIAFFCLIYPMFLQECIKLKYGIDLNFGGISFKPPKHPYNFKNTTNRKNLYVLQGDWAYTPTLAHILARVAQIQNLTAHFIGGKVGVEYLNLDKEKILEEVAEFDNDFVERGVLSGMDLWLGKRDPNATMNKTLCITCQFHEHCKVGANRLKGNSR